MMLFTIVMIFISFCLLLYNYLMRSSRMEQLTTNIPSLKRWPIIGSVLEFMAISDCLQTLCRFTDEHGPIFSFWAGNKLLIVLSGLNEIQTILTNNTLLTKSEFYDFMKPWIGTGLITSSGEEWHRQRKILAPAFQFKILQRFIVNFSSNTNTLVHTLKNEVGKPGFDITEYISCCSLNIIFETAMGVKINVQLEEKKTNEILHAVTNAIEFLFKRVLRPWLHPNLFFKFSSIGKNFYQSIDKIHNFVEEVIHTRRKFKVKNKTEDENNESVLGLKKPSPLLDLLIDYNMTDEEIKSQVNTFMAAGYDTVATTINFTIYCLMKYPETQDKVIEELNEIFGDSDRPATNDDLKNMKYLECVIKESMRLYPPVTVIGRKMTDDFQLSSDYVLPKGSTALLFIYKLHRDPKVYPDPEIFNPDRFLPEVAKLRNPYAFCPFSAGPRDCIGQKFAMLEMKAVISAILRNFKILPPDDCPDIVLVMEVMLKSLSGVYVRLENR
ncbi:cytochrome P450 4C1-like isoform X1 [Lycorma delicatula]|uniref:cytochrome P450 4C1-like isoform X1 n=1 Tax=Lycorma delicatula TaxID=130591 RepID=UPI003F514EB0